MLTGESSYQIGSYNLPVCDVQEKKRNFPGYTESQVYTLDELRGGDTSGTTDTDSKTSSQGDEGSTRIYNKRGKVR